MSWQSESIPMRRCISVKSAVTLWSLCDGLDALRRHRLIGDQQQRAAGNLVVEPGDEDGRRLHVNGHAADPTQILLQLLIVLPHAAVGGIDRAGPVVAPMVADGGGDGLLQAEGGQRRHFRREIIIRGALAADGRNRQDEVAQLVLLLQPAAFAEEQAGLGLDGAQQVHDGRRVGAAHAEVDDGDAVGRRVEHRAGLRRAPAPYATRRTGARSC